MSMRVNSDECDLNLYVQMTKTHSSTRNRVFGETNLVKTRYYKWDIYWKIILLFQDYGILKRIFPYKASPYKTRSEKSPKKECQKLQVYFRYLACTALRFASKVTRHFFKKMITILKIMTPCNQTWNNFLSL